MNCPYCNSKTRMQVQIQISAPGELERKLTKKAFATKDVQIIAALWETADFICMNPKCRKVHNGYGNYVTRLEKELRELKGRKL